MTADPPDLSNRFDDWGDPFEGWEDLFGADTTDPIFGVHVGHQTVRTHGPDRCAGQRCVLHNPSDHHMRGWPSVLRLDRGITERTCPHGVGHPDPDDLVYHVAAGREYQGVHGCDGCCASPTSTPV